jgi:hypothetical protein
MNLTNLILSQTPIISVPSKMSFYTPKGNLKSVPTLTKTGAISTRNNKKVIKFVGNEENTFRIDNMGTNGVIKPRAKAKAKAKDLKIEEIAFEEKPKEIIKVKGEKPDYKKLTKHLEEADRLLEAMINFDNMNYDKEIKDQIKKAEKFTDDSSMTFFTKTKNKILSQLKNLKDVRKVIKRN